MVKVKLCGLKRPCDIAWANAMHPDFIGLVFAGKKRRVTEEQAASLRQLLRPDIPAVGVFVNDDTAHIASLVQRGTIQMVQLHGQEDDAYVRRIQEETAVPVIKAFSVTDRESLAAAVQSSADYILLDNGPGGTGEAFDWSLMEQIDRPFFLAGGLHADNVAEALRWHPYAVDVSSGIETNGVKDKDKIVAFMARVWYAQQEGI